MKNIALIVILSIAAVFGASSCTFSQDIKEYSAAYTPIHSAAVLQAAVQLKHLEQVIERYIEKKAAEGDENPTIQMENPLYDPEDTSEDAEPEFKDIDAKIYLEELRDSQETLLELAEGQEVLNESLQADEGIKPLIEGVKEVMSDEELIELLKKYGPLLTKGTSTE